MISTRTHGIIDYIYGILLISVPFIINVYGILLVGAPFGPGYDSSAMLWSMVGVGAFVIVSSLLTDYEASAVRLIPMRVHLSLDVVAGVFLVLSPWLFDFADLIWWPHVLFGAVAIIVPFFTAHTPSYGVEQSQRDPVPRTERRR